MSYDFFKPSKPSTNLPIYKSTHLQKSYTEHRRVGTEPHREIINDAL